MSRVATHQVMDPNRFKVLKKRCITCPFSKNQQTVPAERLVDIKATLRRTQGPFMCHKGLKYDLVCRGYFDTAGNLVIALARRLGIMEYMSLEEAEVMGRCQGQGRHWFTDRVGEYRSDCRRCHAPNPRCPTEVAFAMGEYQEALTIGQDGLPEPHPRVPWGWKSCGRKTDERGYCPQHGPANTYGVEVK